MARNRKRAKERRARRPQPVATTRGGREDTPDPIAHAAPDVELAEAQLAMGRPETEAEVDPEPEDDERGVAEAMAPEEEEEFEPEPQPIGAGGERDRVRIGAGFDGDPGGGGGGVAAPGAAAAPLPEVRPRAGNRLIGFLQGSWRELQRVQWPDRRQVVQATGVVIGFVIVAGVFLGVADLVAQKIMKFILG